MTTSLCIYYPEQGGPEARLLPVDYEARAACLPRCQGTETKTIKWWEFDDSVFRGVKSDWTIWVQLTFNELPSGNLNEHVPWIRGDAFLSVTVEGGPDEDSELEDGDVATFDLDFTELATMEEFGGLLEGYNAYRAADARVMSGARPGILDLNDILATPAAAEALAAQDELDRCPWIADPAIKLGIVASV